MSKIACRGALLTMGSHLGTLAAARDLGREGIAIALADSSTRTLTGVSKFVSAFYQTPARFYGQMGLEIARGLPLARLAYAGLH